MANLFDNAQTSGGAISLPTADGVTSTFRTNTSSVQNFSTAGSQQTANEVLLKMSASGQTENFTAMTESVCRIPASVPSFTPGFKKGYFPDYTGTDFTPSNINQTMGALSVPGRNGKQVLVTTEAQQLKDLRSKIRSLVPANTEQTNGYKVSLVSTLDPTRRFTFEITPTFSDARTANYTPLDVLHHPGQMQVYKSTESRNFQLQGKLISNTSAEAANNLYYINLIRSWVMPFYGTGTEADPETKKYFGAPPEVLWFSAYGKFHFEKIPVVLTGYSLAYDEQYDMIPATTTTDEQPDLQLFNSDGRTLVPMPVIMAVTLDIRESYSPTEFSSFDLRQYRDGDLVSSFLSKEI